MDAGLVADLRKLNIEERPKNLPPELEIICGSVEQRFVEAKRLEDEGMTNSPEYMATEAALRIAVDDLKDYRTDDGWDTGRFLQDHPQEPYPCKGFPCQPWHGTGVPVFLDNSDAFFYHDPKADGKGYRARTGVVGVDRDPWGAFIHESQELIIGSGLYRPTETHHSPSTIDPFGLGRGVIADDIEGVPMGPEHEMRYSLPSHVPHVDNETLRRMLIDIMVDNPPDIEDSSDKPPAVDGNEKPPGTT